MTFWILLAGFIILMVFVERVLPKAYKSWVPAILMVILTFLGMFRLEIGKDYDWYAFLFYTVKLGDIYPDQSFILIASFLREYGFSYQSVFVVYTLLTMGFLWAGIRRLTKDTQYQTLAIATFFAVHYMDALTLMRQAVSQAIILWAYQYAVRRQLIKYILAVIFAGFFHSSALFMIVLWLVPRKVYALKKYVVGFIGGVVLGKLNLLANIIMIGLPPLLLAVGVNPFFLRYFDGDHDSAVGSGVYLIYQFLVLLFVLYSLRNNKDSDQALIGSAHNWFLGIFTFFALSFLGSMLRIANYFNYFDIIVIPLAVVLLNNMKVKVKSSHYKPYLGYVFLFIAMFMMLRTTAYIPQNYDGFWMVKTPSSMNINYEFNFKLRD